MLSHDAFGLADMSTLLLGILLVRKSSNCEGSEHDSWECRNHLCLCVTSISLYIKSCKLINRCTEKTSMPHVRTFTYPF